MQDSNQIASSNQQIDLPLQNLLTDPNDLLSYNQLVKDIYQLFNEGEILKGKARTKLWEIFLSKVNDFIKNSNSHLINFRRNIAAGAIIFKIDSNKIFIFAKLAYLQKIFQKLNTIPSLSTISKRIGQIVNFKINDIPFLSNFLCFMNNVKLLYPNCIIGWSLYEIPYNLINVLSINTYMMFYDQTELYNAKLIDSIIDDDENSFNSLLSQLSNDSLNINHRFSMTKYKIPAIIKDNPTLLCLCSLFNASNCFFLLYNSIQRCFLSTEINRTDDKGRSLIHFTVAGGCMAIIYQLEKFGFNITQKYDIDGYGPMHYSAKSGTTEAFRFLWCKGVDMFSDSAILSPFHLACQYGNLEIISFIYQNDSNIKIPSYCFSKCENINPLCLACENDRDNVVSFLLDKIYLPRQQEININEFILAACHSCCQNGSLSCLKILFMHNMNEILHDHSLLAEATEKGHLDIIKFIFQKNSFFEEDTEKLKNHLQNAVLNNKLEVVKYYINHNLGKYLDKSDINDLFFKSLGNINLIKYLDKIFNINYDINGKHYIREACFLKDIQVLSFLLAKKCEIEVDLLQTLHEQKSPLLQFLMIKSKTYTDIIGSKKDVTTEQGVENQGNQLCCQQGDNTFCWSSSNNNKSSGCNTSLSFLDIDGEIVVEKYMYTENDYKLIIMNYNSDFEYKYDSDPFGTKRMNIQRQNKANQRLLKAQNLQNAKASMLLTNNQKTNNAMCNHEIITVPTKEKYLLDLFLENINKNLTRHPCGYRYYKDVVDFCYCIKYGPKPYENIRRIIPIPTVRSLKIRKDKQFKSIKKSMINGDVNIVINLILRKYVSPQANKKVNCLLSIDAIEVSLYKKSNNFFKSLFIFYLIPLDNCHKPFPIKVVKHQNGKANSDFIQLIKEITKKIMANSPCINLKYLSTDGDTGYFPEYESEFKLLFDYFKAHGIEGYTKIIGKLIFLYSQKGECLIIADLIHFLKNRRTQIIFSQINMKNIVVNTSCLQDILNRTAPIADRSSLSKLQDVFPIEIFNFQIFLEVFKSGNYDLAFYLFPACCWNESFNNSKIGKLTRLFLLECGLFGFKRFHEIQQKSQDSTEIMPAIAIKRAFTAISLSWNEFSESEGIFKFSNLGTMLQEHFHALIRGMTGSVDTIDNTINCIIRSNIILEILDKQGAVVSGRTRYSVGGTHYNPDIHSFELIYEDKPENIINRLEKMSVYGNYTDFPDLFIPCFCSFIETIAAGSLRISCTNKHFHYGRRIISREITNSVEIKKETNQENTIAENEEFYEEYDDSNLKNDIELINKLINDNDDDEEEEIIEQEEEMVEQEEKEEMIEQEEEELNEHLINNWNFKIIIIIIFI